MWWDLHDVSLCIQDSSPHVHLVVFRLLQLSSTYSISDILLRHLQAIQNAAARLVTGTRRCNHITQVLQQLHWLPAWQWVEFKLAVLAYKVLSVSVGQLPARCHYRASSASIIGNFKCTITCTSSCLEDRTFVAARPLLWNRLPRQVCRLDLS